MERKNKEKRESSIIAAGPKESIASEGPRLGGERKGESDSGKDVRTAPRGKNPLHTGELEKKEIEWQGEHRRPAPSEKQKSVRRKRAWGILEWERKERGSPPQSALDIAL